MTANRSRSRGGRRFVVNPHKPRGVIPPRVQMVDVHGNVVREVLT